MNNVKKPVTGESRSWLLLLVVLLAVLILITLLITPSVYQFTAGVKGGEDGGLVSEDERTWRTARPMPVVEDYFAKGWDFRARNTEEQVLVLTTADESFESKLFKIGSSINLCAHLGYAPPLVVVDSHRINDAGTQGISQDLPELLQDIFPRLRFVSVPDPERYLSSIFPTAMQLRGTFHRESAHREDFSTFPKLESSTIIVSGSWESWEYVDDYRPALFEHLEFHPVIYHHCRKSYPVLFDRRTPVRGVFIGGSDKFPLADIRWFINRSPIENEKILVFINKDIVPENNPQWGEFEEEFKSKALIISGEPSYVQIYLGVFCKELLVDLSNLGWWVGFHGIYRDRTVYYTNPSDDIPLIEHYLHPSFRSNKN